MIRIDDSGPVVTGSAMVAPGKELRRKTKSGVADQGGHERDEHRRLARDALPPVEEFTYLRLGEVTTNDPNWDVGISDVLAQPYYDSTGLAGSIDAAGDLGVVYDRIPKGEVELRRSSRVQAANGDYLGDVDGFLVDEDHITHFVLERGHLWGRREVTVPIGAVESVESDIVTLKLTKDEVGDLPSHKVHRW